MTDCFGLKFEQTPFCPNCKVTVSCSREYARKLRRDAELSRDAERPTYVHSVDISRKRRMPCQESLEARRISARERKDRNKRYDKFFSRYHLLDSMTSVTSCYGLKYNSDSLLCQNCVVAFMCKSEISGESNE